MLRLLADENFDHDIVRGLKRWLPELDVVTVQSAGLSGSSDPDLLSWAAVEQRILVTHDFRTIPKYAYQRIRVGAPMAGIFAVPEVLPVGEAIDQLHLLVTCSEHEEWKHIILYLPL